MTFAVQVGAQKLEIDVDPDDVAVANAQMILKSLCGRHDAAIRVEPVETGHEAAAAPSEPASPTIVHVS